MRIQSKYYSLLAVSLVLSISMFIGIKYECSASETMPVYYASPFVFKRSSLASSMEFYYSLTGIFANWFCWFIMLFLLQYLFRPILQKIQSPIIILAFKISLFLYMTLLVIQTVLMAGNDFGIGGNYWYFEMENEAKAWSAICEKNFVFFNQ